MRMNRIMLLVAVAAALSACESEKVQVLKSPCAGIDGSPCGPKRPVNGALNPQVYSTHPDQA